MSNSEASRVRNPKIVVITQARIGSSRLPGKVLRPLGDSTLLECHLERLKSSKSPQEIVVATTLEDDVKPLLSLVSGAGVAYFQGSTTDVLERFYRAAEHHKAELVVRVTSDCPLIDGELLDKVILEAVKSGVDYCSNVLIESFPDVQDMEVMKFSALETAWKEATLQSDREHVTPFIRRNSDFFGESRFRATNLECEQHYGDIRMTVDEAADLEAVEALIGALGKEARWRDYADYIRSNISRFSNQAINRNEGYKPSSHDAKNNA